MLINTFRVLHSTLMGLGAQRGIKIVKIRKDMVLCSFSAARLNDFWWKHRCWCQNGPWLTPLSPATDKLDLLLVALLIWWSWAMFMWWHMAGSEMSAAGFSTSFRLGGNSSNPQTHMAAGPQHFWKWYSFTRADSSNGARIGFRKKKKKIKKRHPLLLCHVKLLSQD